MTAAGRADDRVPGGTADRRSTRAAHAAGRWPWPVRAALAIAVPIALIAANVWFVCSPLYLRLAYGPLRPPAAPLAGPPDWLAAAARATTDYVTARAGRDAVALLVDVAPEGGDRAAAAADPTAGDAERPPARTGSAAAGGTGGDAGGRALYNLAELDHLADVRRVIAALFVLGIAAAAAVALALAADASPGRWRARAAVVRGGQLAVGLTLLVGLLVAVAWNSLFTAFHALLFPPGTWQFPSDSRLIQLFPNWFWQSAAAVLAGMLLVEGLLLSRIAGRRRPGPAR